MSNKRMIDIISCECLDAKYWRIKYRISGLIFDDIFERVTRLEESPVTAEKVKNE